MPGHSLDVLASLTAAVPASLVRLAEGWAPGTTPMTPRAAASVVLCRDAAEGLETYLLHRHARMAFAASMVVFPGGGVDPADTATPDPLVACAIRETREETGVELTPGHLVPWAHWVTPTVQPIRYDTFFYVAGQPAGQLAADCSTETERAEWAAPAAAVTAYRAGRIAMLPPTLSILTELAAVRSVSEVLELGRDRVVETVLPDVVRDADGWVYRYPRRVRGASDD
jgi:8-oxo-dGTP pyrophosphatase MutT (NUDIX family)